MIIPAAAVAETYARKFAKRFPVKNDGTPAAITWDRGNRPPAYPFENQRQTYGSRRSHGMAWAIWAYHAVLGDVVELRTVVRGQRKVYDLKATPVEAFGYLVWGSYRPGFNLGASTCRQFLDALQRVSPLAKTS